jgi:hypothetical protein
MSNVRRRKDRKTPENLQHMRAPSSTPPAAIRTTFEAVLADPHSFPMDLALYLKEGEGWRLDQPAMIIDPNVEDDDAEPLSQQVIREKWQYILEISVVQSIIDHLASASTGCSMEDRLNSFVYYFEHDAYFDGGA